MAGIVNLSKARKRRKRVKKKTKADENAVKFGLTKAQEGVERARAAKAARDHDGHETE